MRRGTKGTESGFNRPPQHSGVRAIRFFLFALFGREIRPHLSRGTDVVAVPLLHRGTAPPGAPEPTTRGVRETEMT